MIHPTLALILLNVFIFAVVLKAKHDAPDLKSEDPDVLWTTSTIEKYEKSGLLFVDFVPIFSLTQLIKRLTR